jgi:hypothetical protein
MAIFGDDNDYGQMIVDFVVERLNDFNCTIVSGEEENIMDKCKLAVRKIKQT